MSTLTKHQQIYRNNKLLNEKNDDVIRNYKEIFSDIKPF